MVQSLDHGVADTSADRPFISDHVEGNSSLIHISLGSCKNNPTPKEMGKKYPIAFVGRKKILLRKREKNILSQVKIPSPEAIYVLIDYE